MNYPMAIRAQRLEILGIVVIAITVSVVDV